MTDVNRSNCSVSRLLCSRGNDFSSKGRSILPSKVQPNLQLTYALSKQESNRSVNQFCTLGGILSNRFMLHYFGSQFDRHICQPKYTLNSNMNLLLVRQAYAFSSILELLVYLRSTY